MNDILDLSKIEAGKFSIIEDVYTTESLVEDAVAVINARNIDQRVPVYFHIQEDMPPTLKGDAVRIKQVMLNYASNAIKYTERGRIDITIRCEEKTDDMALLKYEVEDTGQGIREKDLDKLFEMYTQLNMEKNHGKEGSGIGLAISKYFVDQMGGTVGVHSKYGEGSRFYFTVPQKIPNQADAQRATAGVRERLLDSGMDDYLSKPIQIPELYRIVRKYLPQEKIIEDEEAAVKEPVLDGADQEAFSSQTHRFRYPANVTHSR